MLKLYCIPKCSTCAKARKWLEQQAVSYEEINLKERTPSKEEWIQWIQQSGLPIKSFFNTSGTVYKEKNLKTVVPSLTLDEAAELLSQDGMLVKRPLAVDDEGTCTVGFKENIYQEKWKKESVSNG